MTPEEHYRKAEQYAGLMDGVTNISQVKRLAIKAKVHAMLAQGFDTEPEWLPMGLTEDRVEMGTGTMMFGPAESEEERFLRAVRAAEVLGEKIARTAETFPRRTGNTDAQTKANVPPLPFVLEEWDGESLTMKQALAQFGGYLSACWSNLSGAGEFESTRASDAVDVMAAFVQRELDTKSIVHDCCVKAEANALPDRTEVEQLRKATEAWVGQPSHKLDNVDQVSEALRLLRRWLVTDTTLRSPAVLEGLPDIPEGHLRVVADYDTGVSFSGGALDGATYGMVSANDGNGPAHASFLRVFYRNSDAETVQRHVTPEEHEPEFGEPFRPGAVQTLGGTTYTATDGDEKLSIRVSDYQHEQGSVWARTWTDGQRNGLQIYVKHSNGQRTILKEETREL